MFKSIQLWLIVTSITLQAVARPVRLDIIWPAFINVMLAQLVVLLVMEEPLTQPLYKDITSLMLHTAIFASFQIVRVVHRPE